MTTNRSLNLGQALAIGALWGTVEIFGGAALKKVGLAPVTGSILAALTSFFLAISIFATERYHFYFITLLVAAIFRIVNSVTWHLPAMHSGFGNPVFGMASEALALFALLVLFRKSIRRGSIQSLVGATYALVAGLAFPAVKIFTGIPACVYKNIPIPLSIIYAPLAMVLALFLFPLGSTFGLQIKRRFEMSPNALPASLLWALPLGAFTLLLLAAFIHV